MNLQQLFNVKVTENGDLAFSKASMNPLINILFMTEYFQNHLNEVPEIGTSEEAQLFARFIRDPRYGLGRRDLGRCLMAMANVPMDKIIASGRIDDVFYQNFSIEGYHATLDYLKTEIEKGNELVKKWMPRYSSKNLLLARQIAKYWGMNKQEYGHFIKCSMTPEFKLSHKNTEAIKFEHLPSLALLKYWNRFATGEDTKERFKEYLEAVKAGKADLKVSTTTVYDIYRNMDKIDADLCFSKMEKISINCLPIIDVSGSMYNSTDAIGKALAIGHYLAKCSTYCPDSFVTFSQDPELVQLTGANYSEQLQTISKAHWGFNTDFGAVMRLLQHLDTFPDYLVVLSDMEFDMGSFGNKVALEKLWKENGYTTKIVWWNLNSRGTTAPEMDDMGNIFLSGYSPMLLKFLSVNFDARAFLDVLLAEYKKAIKE